MVIKKILVPVAFLDGSLRVVQQATYLARHFKSEIILLHVVQPLGYLEAMVVSGARNLHEQMIEKAKEDLEQSLREEFKGIEVRRLLLTGQAAREIVATARNERADLIVMATHGEGRFYRLLLGSVTAKVLHEVGCPVWTGAHLEETPAGNFAIRNVLCAMDLTEHAARTLKLAAEFANEFGARLTVGHVTAGVEAYGPGGPHVDPQWKEMLVSFAQKEIARLQQEAGTRAEAVIESGNAPALIAKIAEQTKADVLIVGRTPPGGHLGQNGDAYSIIRDARVPLLSL